MKSPMGLFAWSVSLFQQPVLCPLRRLDFTILLEASKEVSKVFLVGIRDSVSQVSGWALRRFWLVSQELGASTEGVFRGDNRQFPQENFGSRPPQAWFQEMAEESSQDSSQSAIIWRDVPVSASSVRLGPRGRLPLGPEVQSWYQFGSSQPRVLEGSHESVGPIGAIISLWLWPPWASGQMRSVVAPPVGDFGSKALNGLWTLSPGRSSETDFQTGGIGVDLPFHQNILKCL
ncbi:hypothetical protein NPIL_114681 [Nephila pilipes]|uniref:Uncharacterized protein n=1 Tax=Nephila pilipes TaxID=299642 RepID=A0A8X6TYT3_NEPPI|nr:hypothetical protein NPIL_114681 [Nephila pilipes]